MVRPGILSSASRGNPYSGGGAPYAVTEYAHGITTTNSASVAFASFFGGLGAWMIAIWYINKGVCPGGGCCSSQWLPVWLLVDGCVLVIGSFLVSFVCTLSNQGAKWLGDEACQNSWMYNINIGCRLFLFALIALLVGGIIGLWTTANGSDSSTCGDLKRFGHLSLWLLLIFGIISCCGLTSVIQLAGSLKPTPTELTTARGRIDPFLPAGALEVGLQTVQGRNVLVQNAA